MTITAPAGFVAAGLACGVKAGDAPDLALLAAADGALVPTAAVFTTNKMTAAPVVVSRRHLAASGGRMAAVVLNSGNANAATGAEGLADSARMCDAVAAEHGCAPHEVLVCSTGLIGIPLPMGAIESGIPKLVAALAGGAEAGADAAEAIRTTDTHRKEALIDRGGFSVGGMAKGAGMLAPNLATMLAVLTTDAAAEPEALQRILSLAADETFNRFTVDGCTSTNDTVVLMSSGRAGAAGRTVPEAELVEAVTAACADLVAQLADDAEGVTKVVRLVVTGAASHDEAHRAARRVADSLLVKCSWYGEDPYWGRIASELGSAGVEFDADRVSVGYGGVVVARDGRAVDHDESAVDRHLAGRNLEVTADLGLGDGRAGMLTTDLGHAYIDENMGTS